MGQLEFGQQLMLATREDRRVAFQLASSGDFNFFELKALHSGSPGNMWVFNGFSISSLTVSHPPFIFGVL